MRAGTLFLSSASLTTGSQMTSLYAIEARSPKASLISLCLWITRPSILQSRACSILDWEPHSQASLAYVSKHNGDVLP